MHVIVLTGAGISAESGLQTFRASDGLWENHKIEEVATPEGFLANPHLVQNFYNARRRQLFSDRVNCNAAHIALANLEKKLSGQLTLVTQNVDNLHQRAGSQNVLPMHGELLKARCLVCDAAMDWPDDIENGSQCTQCKSVGQLRPHIVWFGEVPLYMQEIETALLQCDVFIAIGTSSSVYPAAGFYQQAKAQGAHCVELNLAESQCASRYDEVHLGPATQVVPAYVEHLLKHNT